MPVPTSPPTSSPTPSETPLKPISAAPPSPSSSPDLSESTDLIQSTNDLLSGSAISSIPPTHLRNLRTALSTSTRLLLSHSPSVALSHLSPALSSLTPPSPTSPESSSLAALRARLVALQTTALFSLASPSPTHILQSIHAQYPENIPARVVLPFLLGCLKVGDSEKAREVAEEWFADDTGGEEDGEGREKVREVYVLHVLPRLGEWGVARDWVEFAGLEGGKKEAYLASLTASEAAAMRPPSPPFPSQPARTPSSASLSSSPSSSTNSTTTARPSPPNRAATSSQPTPQSHAALRSRLTPQLPSGFPGSPSAPVPPTPTPAPQTTLRIIREALVRALPPFALFLALVLFLRRGRGGVLGGVGPEARRRLRGGSEAQAGVGRRLLEGVMETVRMAGRGLTL